MATGNAQQGENTTIQRVPHPFLVANETNHFAIQGSESLNTVSTDLNPSPGGDASVSLFCSLLSKQNDIGQAVPWAKDSMSTVPIQPQN